MVQWKTSTTYLTSLISELLAKKKSRRQQPWHCSHGISRAPFQYPIRRLIVRSRKVSKARDRVLKCSYRFEIWQASRRQCCRGACQISERSDNSQYRSRGFETLRDLMIRRLIGYWNGVQVWAWELEKLMINTFYRLVYAIGSAAITCVKLQIYWHIINTKIETLNILWHIVFMHQDTIS